MKIVSKLTLRYILKNKVKTALTLLGIIISVAMIISVNVLGTSYQNTLIDEYIARDGDYDFKVMKVNSKDISILSEIRDLDFTYKISEDKVARDYIKNEKLNLNFFISYRFQEINDSYLNNQVNKNILIEGKYPSKDGEIIVANDMKYLHPDFKIGNKIKLKISKNLEEYYPENPFSKIYLEDAKKNHDLKIEIKNKIPTFDSFLNLANLYEDEKEYTIVGYHKKPSSSDKSNYIYGVFKEDVKDDNLYFYNTEIIAYNSQLPENYNLYGKFRSYNNLNHNREIIEKINKDNNGVQIIDNDVHFTKANINDFLIKSKNPTFSKDYNFLFLFSLALASLIITAIVLFIHNIFTSNYVERLHDLGLLKISGFTNSQLFKMVFLDSLFYSIVAIPLGILAGHIGMKFVFNEINKALVQVELLTSINFTISYDITILLISILIIFVVIFLSNLISALFVFRATPIQALNGSIRKSNKRYKARKRRVLRKIFGYEGFLAGRYIDGNRKRFIMTTISITMSIILFVVFSGITGFTNNEFFDRFQTKEYTNATINADSIMADYAKKVLENTKGISINAYKISHHTNMMLKDKNIDKLPKNFESPYGKEFMFFVNILDDKTFENIFGNTNAMYMGSTQEIEDKNYKANPDGTYDVTLVDTYISKQPANYDEKTEFLETDDFRYSARKDSEIELNVRALSADDPIWDKNLFNSNSNILVIKDSMKNELFEKFKDKGYDFNGLYSRTTFAVNRTEFGKEAAYDLSARLKTIPDANLHSNSLPMLSIFKLLVYGFIGLIISIGVINIVNTAYTNTLTRRTEFALIKTIGVEDRRLKKMIVLENTLSLLIAAILSLIGSIAYSLLLYRIVEKEFRFSKELLQVIGKYAIPIRTWAIAVGLVFIAVYIFIMIPYNKMTKENITDVLK